MSRFTRFTIVSRDLPSGLHRVECLETGGSAVGGFHSSKPGVCYIDNIDSGFPRPFPGRGVGSLLLGRWLSDMYRRGCRVFCSTPYSESAGALYARFVRLGILGEPVDWFDSGKPRCWRIVRV